MRRYVDPALLLDRLIVAVQRVSSYKTPCMCYPRSEFLFKSIVNSLENFHFHREAARSVEAGWSKFIRFYEIRRRISMKIRVSVAGLDRSRVRCISSFGATLAAPCVSQRKSERLADYLGGIHISPSSDLKLGFMSFDHVKLSAWVERDTWTNAIRKLHPLSVIVLLLMPLCYFYFSLLVRKQPVDIKFEHFDRFVAMIF